MVRIIAFSKMAAFFYLGFYTLIVGSIFFTFRVNNLYSYAILKVNNYTILMLVASSVNIMSLIGFPPLIGFVCKLAGFYVLRASPYILFRLVVSSLISFGYYLFIVFSVCIRYSRVKGAPQRINWKVLVAQIGFIGLSLLGPIVYGLIFFL
jgi:NADH:ubiquinone oxidoreductase subunit 2 (subunit N)